MVNGIRKSLPLQWQVGCGAGGDDGWQALQLSYTVPHQIRHARRGFEALTPQRGLESQKSIRTESRIDRPERDKRLCEEAGAHKQNQGQGNLCGNESPAQPGSPEAGRRGSGSSGQHLVHTVSGCPHGRVDPDEDARAGGGQHREGGDPPVQYKCGRVVAEAREIDRTETEKRARAGQAESNAAEATGRRQQETLDRELAKQLCAGGAQRGPDGHFASAAYAPNDEEIRDVRARDEQKEPDRACDQQKRGTIGANHDLLQRFRSEGGFRAQNAGKPSSELGGQRLERRVGRSRRGGCLESRCGAKNGRVRGAVGVDPQGQKDIGYEAEDVDIEFPFQNADYEPRNAVDQNRRSDYLRITPESPPPEVVAEYRDLAFSRSILLGEKGPSMTRAPTEQAEEIRADHRNGQRLGCRAAGQVPGAEAVRGEVPDPGGLLPKQIEDSRGHLRSAPSCGGTRPRQEDDDPLGVRVGQRLQQDRVQHREDGRARTEAQRQCDDRGQREAGRSREAANGDSQVLKPHLPLSLRRAWDNSRCG